MTEAGAKQLRHAVELMQRALYQLAGRRAARLLKAQALLDEAAAAKKNVRRRDHNSRTRGG
jgi:hypothetical protein